MALKPGDVIVKAASAVEPRGFDWTDYLAGLIELGLSGTISTSTWTVTCDDEASPTLTVTSASIVTGAKKTQYILSAGTAGYTYKIVNTITTGDSKIDDRAIYVRIGGSDR